MTTIDGSYFECPKHKIDYRIACETCQEKWAKWFKLTEAMIDGTIADIEEEFQEKI